MFKKEINGNEVVVLEHTDLINSKSSVSTMNFPKEIRREIRSHSFVIFKGKDSFANFENKRPYSGHGLQICVQVGNLK